MSIHGRCEDRVTERTLGAEEAVAVVLVEPDKALLLAGRSGAEAGALAHQARDPVLRQERVFEKDEPGALPGARRSVARHGQSVRQQDIHHDVGGPAGADEGRGCLLIRPDAEPPEMLHDRGRWRRLPYQRGECRPGTYALPAGASGIVGREAPEHGLSQPVWWPGDRQRRQSDDAPHGRVARPGAIGLPRMVVGAARGCDGAL